MKKLICRIIGHKWTGDNKADMVIMLFFTGKHEGCIRCGLLR